MYFNAHVCSLWDTFSFTELGHHYITSCIVNMFVKSPWKYPFTQSLYPLGGWPKTKQG